MVSIAELWAGAAAGGGTPEEISARVGGLIELAQKGEAAERQGKIDLQEMENKAASDRLAKELETRLKITKKENAAAMARLEMELGVRREDMANQLTMSRERLGFDREKLAADVQIERDKLAMAREEMEKIGIPKMEAERWYNEQQVILAQEAQKIDRERVGVERGRLGLDALSKGVELASSPATRFQFLDFANGLANSAEARDWLGALTDATNLTGFGLAADRNVQTMTPAEALNAMVATLTGQTAAQSAQGTGATPGTGAAIYDPYYKVAPNGTVTGPGGSFGYNDAWSWGEANRLANAKSATGTPMVLTASGTNAAGNAVQDGGPATALSQYTTQLNNELGQIEKVADAGASSLAPGTLESLGKDGLAEFVSGLNKLRMDSNAWLRNYELSRPAQGTGPEAAWG